jgi:hypothetical protein
VVVLAPQIADQLARAFHAVGMQSDPQHLEVWVRSVALLASAATSALLRRRARRRHPRIGLRGAGHADVSAECRPDLLG